jgi:hypothetical protein
VASIEDSHVEIVHGLSQAYPVGSYVTTKFTQIFVQNSSTNVTIEGLTFDGNRVNNDLYFAWTDNQAIRGYSGLKVLNNIFVELPGNALTVYGTDVLVDNNTFFGLDGPIVHLSGNDPVNGSTVTISNNRIEDTNRRWRELDHSEGVITISARNNSIRVIRNTVRNAPVPFVGRFHSMMYDWIVRENHVTGTSGIFEGSFFVGTVLRDVQFEQNTFIDVGHSWTYTRIGAGPPVGFAFRDNQVIGGSIELTPLQDSVVTDNVVKSCERPPLVVPSSPTVLTEPNLLGADYCLLAVTVQSYPTIVEAPQGQVLYRVDVSNTEDVGFTAGVSMIQIDDEH